MSRVCALIIFRYHLVPASLFTLTLTMFRCLPSHFFFFFLATPLFSHLQLSSIHHPAIIRPSSYSPVDIQLSIQPIPYLSPTASIHIRPSTLIQSSPILLHVSHPSAFSLTPRNLSTSNSLFAQPFAFLNYSGFIIRFLFFTRQFLSCFLLFHFKGGEGK